MICKIDLNKTSFKNISKQAETTVNRTRATKISKKESLDPEYK